LKEAKKKDNNNKNSSSNDNYSEEEKLLKETFEAIEREGKERGLSNSEILKEQIIFSGEQQRQAIYMFNGLVRAKAPYMTNDTKRMVIEVHNEMVQSLKRSIDEAKRVKEEIEERRSRSNNRS
jgi:hypothetical protein